MRFDEQFVDQVRNSAGIVELIGAYVALKKSGKDYSALCPFHSERTPSFLVSESKQIFKCFGCGEGGDVFKFIMLIENLTFPESIAFLAERAGLALPHSRAGDQQQTRRRHVLELMERVARFYRECLRRSRSAQVARDYLRERGISQDTTDRFGLGFAPSGNCLLRQLRKEGISLDDAVACGLLRQREGDGYYDYFRQRIMVPIRDLSSRVVAFGGRILGEGVPKYLNSPDTVLYHKGRSLFGLDLGREEIRRQDWAILVEGYFDCMIPHQHGIRNVVASLGTGLTTDQVKVLGRYTRNVVLNYDPDSAGVGAALRSLDLFLEQGFSVKVMRLPAGEDPDSFIRREGAEVYQARCRSSEAYIDFVLSRLIESQQAPFSPRGRQQIVSELLPYLLKMPNRIERAGYVSRVAARLQMDDRLLLSELRRMAPGRTRQNSSPAPPAMGSVTFAEKNLLQAVLEAPERFPAWNLLEPELFQGLATGRIFEKILELRQQNDEISIVKIGKNLSEGDDQHLLEALALESNGSCISEEVVKASVRALRQKYYQRLSHQIQAEIQIEEQRGSKANRLAELFAQKAHIRRKMELDLDLP